jgi:hypothetical protein
MCLSVFIGPEDLSLETRPSYPALDVHYIENDSHLHPQIRASHSILVKGRAQELPKRGRVIESHSPGAMVSGNSRMGSGIFSRSTQAVFFAARNAAPNELRGRPVIPSTHGHPYLTIGLVGIGGHRPVRDKNTLEEIGTLRQALRPHSTHRITPRGPHETTLASSATDIVVGSHHHLQSSAG